MFYHILLIHSSVNEHLNSFHFLTVTNNMNILYKFLCGHMFSFLLDVYLGVEMLGNLLTPYLRV